MTISSGEDVTVIKKLLSETYGNLVMAHDAAGYADMYSDDVLWAPPNGTDQKSKEGIKNGIQGLFDKFMFKVDPQPEEVEIQNDFAYAIGTVDGVLTPRAGGDPNTTPTVRFEFCNTPSGFKGFSHKSVHTTVGNPSADAPLGGNLHFQNIGLP